MIVLFGAFVGCQAEVAAFAARTRQANYAKQQAAKERAREQAARDAAAKYLADRQMKRAQPLGLPVAVPAAQAKSSVQDHAPSNDQNKNESAAADSNNKTVEQQRALGRLAVSKPISRSSSTSKSAPSSSSSISSSSSSSSTTTPAKDPARAVSLASTKRATSAPKAAAKNGVGHGHGDDEDDERPPIDPALIDPTKPVPTGVKLTAGTHD